MKICNEHYECVGFTHYPTYNKKDFCVMKSAIIPVENRNSICYEKIYTTTRGNNLHFSFKYIKTYTEAHCY